MEQTLARQGEQSRLPPDSTTRRCPSSERKGSAPAHAPGLDGAHWPQCHLARISGEGWLLAAAGLVWLVSMIAFAYLTSVASQVYRCALFLYASEGTIPEPYSLEL